MPCYGHSHCALCNVPVCPDCVGDGTDEKLIIDVEHCNDYTWLMEGVGIYGDNGCKKDFGNHEVHKDTDGNNVYDVTVYGEGLMGVLMDRDKDIRHSNYASPDAAIFLHKYCWEKIKEMKDKIPTKSLWWFLAVYNIGYNKTSFEDDSSLYDPQCGLYQYRDNIYLLQNPNTNEENNERINSRAEQMLTGYDWDKPFQIGGFVLK
jgi:hypothetical protein